MFISVLRGEHMEHKDKPLFLKAIDELIDFESGNGQFRWKESPRFGNHSKPVGEFAGSYDERGFKYITIRGKRLMATKVAWYCMTGVWPSFAIAHLDGDLVNFQWDNLRPLKFCKAGYLNFAQNKPWLKLKHDGWYCGEDGPYLSPKAAHNETRER